MYTQRAVKSQCVFSVCNPPFFPFFYNYDTTKETRGLKHPPSTQITIENDTYMIHSHTLHTRVGSD